MSQVVKKVKNADEWKSRGVHGVTLPSGAEVSIVIPNLPLLIKIGRIPNELVNAIMEFQSARQVTREMLEEEVEVTRHLVVLTVKEPQISLDDVDDLPFEDVEMVVEFALRQRDMDAVGHHLAGLEKVESFRELRAL